MPSGSVYAPTNASLFRRPTPVKNGLARACNAVDLVQIISPHYAWNCFRTIVERGIQRLTHLIRVPSTDVHNHISDMIEKCLAGLS